MLEEQKEGLLEEYKPQVDIELLEEPQQPPPQKPVWKRVVFVILYVSFLVSVAFQFHLLCQKVFASKPQSKDPPTRKQKSWSEAAFSGTVSMVLYIVNDMNVVMGLAGGLELFAWAAPEHRVSVRFQMRRSNFGRMMGFLLMLTIANVALYIFLTHLRYQ